MATSKLELAVGTGQWDAGLKKAQQALNSFTQSQGGLQQALGKDNEKMVQFVQMMGKIDSTANTAKGQLRDYRNSIEQLSAAFNSLSDAQKKGVEGQTITSALDSLKAKAMKAKQEVERLNVELGGVGKASGTFNQLFSGVAGKFGMSPQMFTGVGAAIAGVGMAAKLAGDNIRTAFNFERSISGLSALTGMVGKDLEKLKNNAIELGSTTTLTASQVADAFRLIGSQQPQLLSDADALKEVTKYAIRLSEAAGIDLSTASQTLSTSINQMGGDSANAARYVNVLAAASQKGAGDISWLGEAITKAATAAKAVGTDYEELVANLEQLAKAGFDASTAGTALRSIIMNLEKQANSQFKPSVVGLTQAFENLGKAQLDITGYQNIAGKMFATQAKVLAEAAGAAKEMEEAITGTNIAEEQARTNTANLDGSLKALASAWEGLNLHINDSNGFLKDCVDWLKETVQWMDNTFTAAGRAKKALDDLRGGGEDGKGRKIDTRTEYEVKEVKSAMQGEGDAAKVKQQQILDKYDRDIATKEKELTNLQKIATTNPGNYLDLLDRVRNEVEALKTLKQEFKSASDALITPKQAPQKTEIIDTEEVEESRRSIKQLQDELKKLKQARDEAADAGKHELVEEYNADIKRIQAEIKTMRGGSTSSKPSTPKTETQQNEAAIAKLTEEYQNLATAAKTADDAQKAGMTERMTAIQGEIKTLQERNAELKKFADEAKGVKVSVGAEGSLPQLTQQLKDLQQAQGQSLDTREWVEYQKQIDATTTKIDILKGKWKEGQVATFKVDAEAYDKLKELQDLTIEDGTITVTADTAEAYNKVQELISGIEGTTVSFDVKPQAKAIPTLDDYRIQAMTALDTQNTKVDTNTLQTLLKDAMEKGIDTTSLDLEPIAEQIGKGIDVPDEKWQAIIDKYNKIREAIGENPIQIDLSTGNVPGGSQNGKGKGGKGIEGMDVSNINKITSSVSSIAGGLQKLGVEIPEGFEKTIGVLQIITTMISALQTITSIGAFKLFASGGIVRANDGVFVPGNSYSGDRVPALLNSGEMVLNSFQQQALAGTLQNRYNEHGNESTPYVSGEQIYLGLNNYLKRSGRGEMLTARG